MNNFVISLLTVLVIASTVQAQDEFTWGEIKSPLRELVTARNNDLIPTITGKIVGGQNATEFQFPHQAAIFINYSDGQYFCGGSIIALKIILTAAHCVEG